MENEVNEYLQHRAKRLKQKNPEFEAKMKQYNDRINRAVEVLPEECLDGEEHAFNLLSHADSSEYYIYYSHCSKCDGVLMTKKKRAVDDPMRF